ncbi:stress-induced protein [Acidovorax sp. GBBC 3334]|uniref:KGG domain-containing protein n=1 Tax=Acidovorax sp. GBBC 3334 TaxID=2940496 RepID=UPI00230414CC|nr:KGG domain-containing protein [Acidovorax sp. GBBC 3334]MDA8455240.1 stress-induced protein [Acidovorax sp. GBBC 3334]
MASNQGNQGNNNQGNQGSGSGRGFAGMDPERQREIAAEGGRAAHASGNAHEFSSEEARRAGSMSHGGGNQNSGNQSGGNQGSSSGTQNNANSGGTRGGSSQQHAEAGRQSHKNDR